MLALWMFGVELERNVGHALLVKYYFACGWARRRRPWCCRSGRCRSCDSMYAARTVGASAHVRRAARLRALLPEPSDLHLLRLPVPAKYFVMIMGAVALLMSRAEPATGPLIRAPGRPRRRLSLSEGDAHQPALRAAVPLSSGASTGCAASSTSTQADAPTTSTVASTERHVNLRMQPRLHRWDEIALEKITEMISQKIVAGEREMLAQIYLKRGALVPMHSHDSEQMTYVLQGSLRFLVGGEEIVVREGEVLHIPSGVPHQAEALDDTFELDVFSPIRADWLAGT